MRALSPPSLALWLGYAGLIPFAAGAAASHGPAWMAPHAVAALSAYAATIAAFLGGVHWGLAFLSAAPRPALFVWGVTPSLLAWVAALLPSSPGLVLLAGTLGLALIVDRRVYPSLGLQGWLAMRLHLTAVAAASCLVGAWSSP